MENRFEHYIELLEEELVPALGCTEPSAIAFSAARAALLLGCMPASLEVACSANILKNAKSAVVPHSGGRRGIQVAAALGAASNAPEKGLEVLSALTDAQQDAAEQLLGKKGSIQIRLLKSPHKLHILTTAHAQSHSAQVEIQGHHTHVVREWRDKALLWETPVDMQDGPKAARQSLSLGSILRFAKNVPLHRVQGIIERQIECNSAIAREGLQNNWGACVGKTLWDTHGSTLQNKARSAAAAGSDARMSGCNMPVIINSGSGNQGLAVSVPVIQYAQELGSTHEALVRALLVSNLVSIYLKQHIGRLSAYCGAVSAATGSAAGIAFLHGAGSEVIETAISNTLANVSGIVCDGAKPSCAAKIASAVDAALLGLEMAQRQYVFNPGEGIIKPSLEETVRAVGTLACAGMQVTDDVILDIMLEE